MVIACLVLAQSACSGGSSGAPAAPAESATRAAQSTVAAATIIARGPTAVAEATTIAQAGGSTPAQGASPADLPPATAAAATARASTATAAAPTAAAQATERASGTPAPSLQLLARRSGDVIEVRVEGSAAGIAAFNFDIVYHQRAITFDAIAAAVDVLDVPGRTFSCNAPPPSVDIDPDPAVGRARVVCFSFGGPDAPAPRAPLTLARITASGSGHLSFENVAVFAPDASGLQVEAPPWELGP